MIVFLLVFFLFGASLCQAGEAQDAVVSKQRSVDDFALLDLNGEFHQLSYYNDHKAIVLISYGIGCPIVRKNILTLEKLHDTFSSRGVAFFYIDPYPQDSREDVLRESSEYHISIPILLDQTGMVAASMQIRRTAESVVIDPQSWTILYQGPIDDRLGYEFERQTAEHEYLKSVLDDVISGEPVSASQALTKGCLLLPIVQEEWTYTNDIAPILKDKCLLCHSPGGVAPWSMDNYERISKWGSMIREVVRTQRMPPWHADPHYGSFQNDISLTTQEAIKVVSWVERGMKKGSGKDILAAQTRVNESQWMLGKPDSIFSFKDQQHLPSNARDVYLILEADRPTEKDLWVRAFEIKPGNASVVHHCNIVVQSLSQEGKGNELTQSMATATADDTQWFKDSGLNMETGQVIAGYSPGMGAFQLPKDTGIFIPKGSRLIFRMHYITTGKPEQDLTRIAFYYLKRRPRKIFSVATITNREIHIPAGERHYSLKGSYTFAEDVALTALQPHMHYRGKSMRFTAFYPDGKNEILLSVPNYKFTWQRQYVFKDFKNISAGTRIELDGVYDNSQQNPLNLDSSQDILYGPGSEDEMFTGIMYFVKNPS